MASADQSAVVYIRNGRAALVRGLQNLHLLENIVRQRELFPNSEIKRIFNQRFSPSEQVQLLLKAALRGGEKVCYDLLRILDDTRDQTFPMPVEKHPELHQWISCFSFGHDPLHGDDKADSSPGEKYQKQLKLKALQILQEKWKQSMSFLKQNAEGKSFRYIPLVLDTDVSAIPHTKIKAYKKTRCKKLKTYIPTDKRKLSPYQLLTCNEKKILLVGKPGIGKTTVVQEILRMWADGEVSEVSYMFYFDESLIRLLSESPRDRSFSWFLFNRYLMPAESAEMVLKDMEENSENVVIIFDGFMDIVKDSLMERIMETEILNGARILITCRPEADISGDLSDWSSFRVEVQGFSESSIQAYFKWMLGTKDDTCALDSLELFSLCHVPIFAFIVTACILISPSEADNHPCTITEMYVRIFRHCLKLVKNVDDVDKYIQENRSNIKSLASRSNQAILSKTVHLEDISLKDTVQHAFLTPVAFEGDITQTAYVFLHNTMQEFWAALYLVLSPDKIGYFLQQSQTEEGKYLKHVAIFLCGLLSEKMGVYLKGLVSHEQIKSISDKYFKDIIKTFLCSEEEDEPDPCVEPEDVLYVCQCLYEYQTPDACLLFLQKVENKLDLNDQPLDPHECCAVSYVISHSDSQTVQLNLMNCTISDSGIKLMLGSLSNLKSIRLSSASIQCQIWRVALQELSTDFGSLLRLFGFEMHLSVKEQTDSKLLQNSKAVLNEKREKKVKLCLHLDTQQIASQLLLKSIFGCLHNIGDIRIISPDYPRRNSDDWKSRVDSFQLDLFLQAALHEKETGHTCIQHLLSLDNHLCSCSPSEQNSFIYTIYLHAKQMGLLATLQPVFSEWPSYWVLDLSQRKTSLLLELLTLQEVKKPVELWCSNEEHELKIFLKCLPYISQLRFNDYIHIQVDDSKAAIKLLVDLFICALDSKDDETLKILSTVCCYSTFPFATNTEEIQTIFLCELFSYIKEYESQKGRESVISAFLPIFQSVPQVWILDLLTIPGEIILQVLNLQVLKKPIELIGWKECEHDKLATLLQCLPHVSQLRIRLSDSSLVSVETCSSLSNFFSNLFISALENGDNLTVKMLSSVCSYSTFPFAVDTGEIQTTFLLELFSHVREYESRTGKRIYPALLPILQSAPSAWVLNLSRDVIYSLHQTMQLQTVKKPVCFWSWSNDKGQLEKFLQCLPFVSQLRLELSLCDENESERKGAVTLILDLFLCALEKGDDTQKMLSSVCSYSTFPFAEDTGEIQSIFLTELYFHITTHESQTGKRFLPALLSIFQSAPNVWVLDLSKGVSSSLLQTMQLQAMKKPLELRGWTNMKIDLKCLLQCLPFVSQLRFSDLALVLNDDIQGAVKLLVDLFTSASENGAEIVNILTTVCSYPTFPFAGDAGEIQTLFLLELFFYVKEYESQTETTFLPTLLPIYQSAPSVWVIDLSKDLMSLLLQIMRFQTKKRAVELKGWTANESELRNILHAVPYMLHLRCSDRFFQSVCEVLSTGPEWNPKEVAVLFQPLNFNITLMEMLPRRICNAVGRALSQANPEESICLSLIPESISWKGIHCLFSSMIRLQKLRLNEYATLKIPRIVKLMRQRSFTIEEVSLVSTNPNLTDGRVSKLISSLALLMRVWTVKSLDLTAFCVEGRFLISLLSLDRPFSVRMSAENVQQLAEAVYETRDDFLTQSFLEKAQGNLSTSSLPWNILENLLHQSRFPLRVDPQNNGFSTLNIQHILPLLHNIRFKGTDSQFVRNALKEIYKSRAGHLVIDLVRTSDNWINLREQELESYDCAALRFALHYSDEVSLNLFGAAIPKEETNSILQLLHRVSEIRIDGHLLLYFLNACSVSTEQREITRNLLTALQNKLNFSHSSTLHLSVMDCHSISTAIQLSDCDTELILFNCQASDDALVELFPALHKTHVRLDKPLLLQFILLTRCAKEGDSLSRARGLSQALGKEIDLSHMPLDCRNCEALGLVLEQFEDLTHLNLSHCKLTDSCLNVLLPHLYKVQLLNLSDNDITDIGAKSLQKILVSAKTVHVFNNYIMDMRFFMNNPHDPEIHSATHVHMEHGDSAKFPGTNEPHYVINASAEIHPQKITSVATFDPEISIHDDQVVYRFDCELGGEFQCRATDLILGMKSRGCIEYSVVQWDMCHFSKDSFEPAGPLYNIETPKGEMYLLHLPHCEIEADNLGYMSVAHIQDGTMELLTPVKITSTHVTVRISGLSSFGIVRRKGCMTRYVRGQVLLFLEQINKIEQRLWVFLLSRNVSTTEIKKQHQDCVAIKTSSDCILRKKGKYCLSTSLRRYKVQPKTYSFHAASDLDHHSAFELFFDIEISEIQLRIHEKLRRLRTRWNRRVILKDNHSIRIKTEDGNNKKGNLLLSEQNWKSSLYDLLEELSEDDLKKVKNYMKNTTGLVRIPKGRLEKKEKYELVDLMVETWGFRNSVYATWVFMNKIPRNDHAVTSILKPYLVQFGFNQDCNVHLI